MDFEQTMNKIKRIGERNKAEKLAQEEKEFREYQEAKRKAEQLLPRVQHLLALREACTDGEIILPSRLFSNVMTHKLGFMGENTQPRNAIGIYAGGYCGDWDLFCNGMKFFYRNQSNGSVKNDVFTHDYLRFVERFDSFEKDFFDYIEALE